VAPVIAFSYTEHAGVRTAYVLAYERTQGAQGAVSFSPADLGIASRAYIYDYFHNTGEVVEAGQSFSTTVDYDGSYFVVAPVGSSGIAFLGDADKFVSCGKKRIEELSDTGGVLRVLVRFASGEKQVMLELHSPIRPTVMVEAGGAGPLSPHAGGRHRVIVRPDPSGQAIVSFTLANGRRNHAPM